ncbi:MAG: ABC transporter substrate-binding protein [Mycobacteriales bacterium]
MPVRRQLRPRYVAVAALGLVLLVLAACGSSGSSTSAGPAKGFKPGVLDKQYSGTTIEVLVPSWAAQPKASIAAFTRVTGIKVHQQTLDFNTLHDKIVTSEAAGNSPADVTEVDWTWVSQFGKARWYADLGKFLPGSTISTDVGSPIFQLDGKQLAVPYNLDFRGMVVDMTVLKKAGITSAPTTWQQVITAGQALRSKAGLANPIALPLSITEGSATPWYALTKAAGGQVLDKDQNPAFGGSGSAGADALTFVKSLYGDKLLAPGSVNLSDQDVTNEFLSGQAAIIPSASPGLLSAAKGADNSKIADHDVQFVSVPGKTAAASNLVGLQEGLGIPARSKHREAAAEFVYWWQQTKAQVTSYTDPNMGNVPSQKDALAALVGQNKLLGGAAIVRLSKEVGPAFSGPAPTWYSQFSTDVASMLQSVAEGHRSAAAGIKQLEQQTKSLKASGK